MIKEERALIGESSQKDGGYYVGIKACKRVHQLPEIEGVLWEGIRIGTPWIFGSAGGGGGGVGAGV